MQKLIKVDLKDGAVCRMAPKALALFLRQEKVFRFERSDGWAVIGLDRVRSIRKEKNYDGLERRIFLD